MTPTTNNPLAMPSKDLPLYLPATGTWPEAWYLLDIRSQNAIQLAVACGRPLLVRGLPGTGKSDLARAAAEYLGRAFVYEVVTARTEPQDLLWRSDSIARLADAQAQAALGKTDKNDPKQADPSNPKHYVSPGVLWWAIRWDLAEQHLNEHTKTLAQYPDKVIKTEQGEPVSQQQRALHKGSVLLLDEIDKADAELPNSLLEVLANTGFRLPWDGEHEIKANHTPQPLIIITTNEDRELPPAFVRRCLVINIQPEGQFDAWIMNRARVHFRDPESKEPATKDDPRPTLKNDVLEEAARLLLEDRENPRGDSPKPGLAEYLDLLRGLHGLAPDDPVGQLAWIERVWGFAYQKQPLSLS